MKRNAITALFSVFLAIPWAAAAQGPKDPSAARVIAQAAELQAQTVQSLRASGVYTRILPDGKQAVYQVQMAAAMPDRVRWDVTGAGNQTTMVVAGNSGWIQIGSKRKQLAIDELAGKGLERFPALLIMAWMDETRFQVTDMGVVTNAGVQYRQLSARRTVAQAGGPTRGALLEQATQVDCYLDPQNGLPLWIRYYDDPVKMGETLPVDLRFSDMRDMGGIIVPMTVTISFDKQTVGLLRFNDIKINAAVAADEFKE